MTATLLRSFTRKFGLSLLESLDDVIDESAEEEWKLEIARRIKELDSGKVKPIAWAEARRQISEILNGH